MDFDKDVKDIQKKAKELEYSLQQLLELIAKVSFMAGMSEAFGITEKKKVKKSNLAPQRGMRV